MPPTDLTADLNTLITQHLPAQVGSALQARLRQADRDAEALSEARGKINTLEQALKDAGVKIRAQEAFDAQVAAHATAAEKLKDDQRELSHRLEVAFIKQQCAEQSKGDVIDLVSQIFRTPGFKRVLSRSENEDVPFQVPGQHYPQTAQRRSSVTTTEEVTPSDKT